MRERPYKTLQLHLRDPLPPIIIIIITVIIIIIIAITIPISSTRA